MQGMIDLQSVSYQQSIIKSAMRLSYDQVDNLIKDEKG